MIFRFAFPCDSNWNIFQIVSLFVRTETDEAQEKRVQMLERLYNFGNNECTQKVAKMKVKRLSARFLCCNLHDSSSDATMHSASVYQESAAVNVIPGSTASLEKEMKPTVSPLINSLVTGSPSLVQENHIISRFMRLSFVFICYMAVTTKIVGSEREKLLQLSILSLQTHDVQRRSSSVPKNRSDEPADCSRWRGDLSYYHKARECQALILIIKASLGVLDYSRVFVKAVNCVAQ
ncbi:hypothetical protein T4B_3508 [Trichinella pseudospiralis]|uniref:Uncharacterized protein n=1 Tax=Trichinella pseudospiralis TaxID=6337 RepID=A0A0V1IB99_TRIPS|nr:hypothetical protein T4B_3508 [Trichinella pseudospiralis]